MGSDDILFEFQLLLMNLNIRNICMWVLYVEGCQKGDADEIYSEQYTPHWAVMLFLIDFYCEYVKNHFVNNCMSVSYWTESLFLLISKEVYSGDLGAYP